MEPPLELYYSTFYNVKSALVKDISLAGDLNLK